MMSYVAVKYLHMVCVILSLAGFCVRGILVFTDSPAKAWRGWRILPHINDTLLFAAGITLAVFIRQTPFLDDWLTAKFFGLVVYIILGVLTLGKNRPPRLRLVAGIAAMLTFGWIVSVALSKNPWGFFAGVL